MSKLVSPWNWKGATPRCNHYGYTYTHTYVGGVSEKICRTCNTVIERNYESASATDLDNTIHYIGGTYYSFNGTMPTSSVPIPKEPEPPLAPAEPAKELKPTVKLDE
jgi:hypothetical protein